MFVTQSTFNIKHAVLAVATAGLLLSALVMPMQAQAQETEELNQAEMLELLNSLLAQLAELQQLLNQQTQTSETEEDEQSDTSGESSFTIGDTVKTTSRLSVRETPGGTRIGIAEWGVEGDILEGPTELDGFNWWKIDYGDGLVGWSADAWLEDMDNDDATDNANDANDANDDSNEFTYGYAEQTLELDGVDRVFGMYVPQSVFDKQNIPVIVVLHGTGGNRLGIRETTQFDMFADRDDFIVVYPESKRINGSKKWDITNSQNDDVTFIEHIVTQLEKEHKDKIDRWYIVGMSNGSVMAQAAACHIQDFIGVGSVSAALGPEGRASCTRTTPIDFIGFYGTEDHFEKIDTFEDTVQFFHTEINNCALSGLAVLRVSRFGNITRYQGIENQNYYGISAGDSSVPSNACGAKSVYYRINSGGHFWPGGVYSAETVAARSGTVGAIDATEEIVNFFLEK